jgi:hypothetical protein
MKKIILFLAIISMVSCKDKGLGADYFYLSSEEASDIGYPYGSIIYRSKDKYIYKDICVFADITRIKTVGETVLIEQRPNKTLLVKLIRDDITFWNQHFTKTRKDRLVKIAGEKIYLSDLQKIPKMDSAVNHIIHNSPKLSLMLKNGTNFYILDVENKTLSKPLSSQEFNIECKNKGISKRVEEPW